MSTENVTPTPSEGLPIEKKLELRAKLHMKICLVMEGLDNLPKNGYNERQNYYYVKEGDAVNAIRVLLAKHKLTILPDLIGEQIVGSTTTKSGSGMNVTKADIRYRITDAETGYQEVIPWAGYGQDTGEKGLYKAITGSHKYFLMKTFQISAGEEQMDPENERRPPSRGSSTAATTGINNSNSKVIGFSSTGQ